MENSRTDLQNIEIAVIQLSYKHAVKLSSLPMITKSADIYELLKQCWCETKLEFVEQFKVLLLNRANRLFGIFEASTGGITGAVADPRLVFAAAIKLNAVRSLSRITIRQGA